MKTLAFFHIGHFGGGGCGPAFVLGGVILAVCLVVVLGCGNKASPGK
jgi:hypothetical protein